MEERRSGFLMVDELPPAKTEIVYQGVAGAYSQMAMKAYFGGEVVGRPMETWRDMMRAIENGEADYAVLPIENSSAGIVSENYDLLVESDCYIAAEQTIGIEHALLGLPGTSLLDIRYVYSHPQALMQCGDYLDRHREWEQVSLKNTAIAAQKLVEDGKKDQAAIASPITADLYGLEILRESINDTASNSTRFLIMSAQKICRKSAGKISICFEIPHKAGSLYHMLAHIIHNDLNMTKIESRPIKAQSFEYRFFLDFEGNFQAAAVQKALRRLEEDSTQFKILGNY